MWESCLARLGPAVSSSLGAGCTFSLEFLQGKKGFADASSAVHLMKVL